MKHAFSFNFRWIPEIHSRIEVASCSMSLADEAAAACLLAGAIHWLNASSF